MQRTVYQTIIQDNFDYFVDKVKKPMMDTLLILGKLWTTPTHENVTQPNSHLLLNHMEEFSKYEQNDSGRKEMMLTVFKVLIDVYDHDPYYRPRFDWLIEQLVDDVIKGKWQPRPDDAPYELWTEKDIKNYQLIEKFRKVSPNNRFK